MKPILYVVLSSLLMLGCQNVYEIDVSRDFQLNESSALKITRDALIKKGIVNASHFIPTPYYPNNKNILAQADGDNNSGYILWNDPKKNKLFEYIVHIKYVDGKVTCRINNAK